MKISVVMYGSHGGELDRYDFITESEEIAMVWAKKRLISLITESTLFFGDKFVIEKGE
jgi:hypothetical protein